MNKLKGNLQLILIEKEEKIIPENIRKGVQIFDITGTLEERPSDEQLAIEIGLTPEVIKDGVTILGVTGTYAGETTE